MSSAPTLTGPEVETGPSIEIDPQGRVADLDDIYLDSTIVLIGCGDAKRDPDDPMDRQLAAVGPDERIRKHGPKGPAWEARNLYTSSYFAVKRDFAKAVTGWAQNRDAAAWGILSAEHDVLMPWEPVRYYDTSIDDLGGDETNPDHWTDKSYPKRRPDGREIVTERDHWAAMVAYGLSKWIASFGDSAAAGSTDVNTLLVLAGEDYVDALRERGVFEYGIARMVGDPNRGTKLPVNVRFPFEELDEAGANDGMGDQMAWLSDAVETIGERVAETEQVELGSWNGQHRTCETCGVSAADADLADYDGTTYCDEHKPLGRCARCDEFTHSTGLGSYPLCDDCSTERGGQKREPIAADVDETEQRSLDPHAGEAINDD